jgi:hypothetical protein
LGPQSCLRLSLRTSISKNLHLGPQNGPGSENLLKIVNCQNGQKIVLSHLENVGGPRYPPGSDAWLILSHLTFVRFFNSSCESLKHHCEFLFLCLSLHDIFSKCLQYLHCDLIAYDLCALCLILCHVLLFIFCLRNDVRCPLLERFHLSLALLLLCLCGYEFFLQLLHI